MDERPAERGVQSVERALDLLETLARSDAPLGVSALAHATHLSPSTTHRLLATLVRRGWVSHDPGTHRYRLTPLGARPTP